MSLFSDARKARLTRAAATPESHREYVRRTVEIDEQLKTLRAKLLEHAARESADRTNWGYAGDLAHIAECLTNAIGE